MARITVEDCITQVPNRFDLVLVGAQRAKEIGAGAPLTVERDNDKNPVVALREIAECTVSVDVLRHSLIDLHRQYAQTETNEDELEDLLEQELSGTRYVVDARQQHDDEGIVGEDSLDDMEDEPDMLKDDEGDDVFPSSDSEKVSPHYEDADIVD